MATSDFQATTPSKRFAQTITHWCHTKLGFREWLTSQVAKHCRYVALRHKSEDKAYDKGMSDQCVSYESPHPPFDGDSLSLGEIATFAVDRFNRLNTRNQIAPKGLAGAAKYIWILSQIHESDLLSSSSNLKDLVEEISHAKFQEFLRTLESHFTRETLAELFAAPRSTIDEVWSVANEMRVRASGEFAGVIAGALAVFRDWYYKAGGIAVLPNVPTSETVNKDGVVEWLSALISACEPRVGSDEPKGSKVDPLPVPVWNSDLCELHLGDQCVRKIRRMAKDPCTILTAFEEDHWPNRIDNPLSPERDLSQAVKTLNYKLLMMRFERDGGREGIVRRLKESS